MYTLSNGYRFYTTHGETILVLMHFINNVPYTFDLLDEFEIEQQSVMIDASSNREYTEEEVYKYSSYLIDEEFHPLLFELDLSNPEILPKL
jgi:hypothetical protein